MKLVRIDNRLIHGQIATQWVAYAKANKIIVVDNVSFNDVFLKKMLMLAAPKNCKVEVFDTKNAGAYYQNRSINKDSTMAVIKDIRTAYEAYFSGFTFSNLQIGGAIKKGNAVNIFKTVYISADDIKMLDELTENGVNIEFQCQLYDDRTSWLNLRSKALQKLSV